MSQFSHVLDAAGVGYAGQLAFGMAVLLTLGAVAGIVVEPGLGGGRKLLWGLLALVPFLGGALWLFAGRSRAEPESAGAASPELDAPSTVSR